MKKSKLLPILLVVGVLIFGLTWLSHHHINLNPLDSSNATKTATGSSTFNKHRYSLDDPSSIWVVANKSRPLNPLTYTPPDLVAPGIPLRYNAGNSEMQLRTQAATALQAMATAAKDQAGLKLMLASGYRSYNLQVSVYNAEVKNYGKTQADRESARPGHSEHQTGLAADLEPAGRNCEIDQCFANTPEGKWIAANAYKYGFILRYPKDKEQITGYMYEPWHVRFVGVDLSTQMHTQGVETLEEFFGVSGGTTYN